jgi:hypothetical protein
MIYWRCAIGAAVKAVGVVVGFLGGAIAVAFLLKWLSVHGPLYAVFGVFGLAVTAWLIGLFRMFYEECMYE